MILNKKLIVALLATISLIACSGSDDSESSSGSNNEGMLTNTETNTNTNNRVDLPPTESGDSCLLNNVILSPPSGSTLSISEDAGIDITVDVELTREFNNLLMEASLESLDRDDSISASLVFGNAGPGRIILEDRFEFGMYIDPDNYTSIEISTLDRLEGETVDVGFGGCGAVIPVNYIITP